MKSDVVRQADSPHRGVVRIGEKSSDSDLVRNAVFPRIGGSEDRREISGSDVVPHAYRPIGLAITGAGNAHGNVGVFICIDGRGRLITMRRPGIVDALASTQTVE